MHNSLKTLTKAALLASTFLGFAFAANAQDTLTINVAVQSMGSAASLETVENGGTAARKFQNSIFEQLIALDLQDPNLALKPGLATEWSWNYPRTQAARRRQVSQWRSDDR